MLGFIDAADAFLANSTLQQIYGYHKPGWPADSYTHLINQTSCEAWLGKQPRYHSWDDASSTLNTWVLPFSALILQAPFDSNNFQAAFFALMRWMGGSMASLSYVLWNMRTSANCAAFIDKATDRRDIPKEFNELEKGKQIQSDFSSIRDVFFLLSVMNQFHLNIAFNGAAAEKLLKIALFSRKLQLPAAEKDIEVVRKALARDTREARKRGTVQVFISMSWFCFGMCISIQEAFGLLGQNAAAHNLALGLTMIWFPVLMLCTVVDRNPAVPDVTQRQLNVFLGLVREALLRDVGRHKIDNPHSLRLRLSSFDDKITGSPVKIAPMPSIIQNLESSNSSLSSLDQNPPRNWFSSSECDSTSASDLRWIDSISDPALDHAEFFKGFAGQGRKVWHYGVAHPIIQGLKTDGVMNTRRGWLYDPDVRSKLIRTVNPERRDRLHNFDLREFWQISMSIFTIWGSCVSALIISYYTPTVGLGCRALGYIIFATTTTGLLIIELLIWYLTPHHKIHVSQKASEDNPPIKHVQLRTYGLYFLRIGEFINSAWLVYILFAQALGSYNTCKCKCSNYGFGGGYIDFALVIDPPSSNAFALPYWITGTAMGCSILVICFGFIAWEWVTQSHLSSENYRLAMNGLKTTRRFKKWTKFLLPFQA